MKIGKRSIRYFVLLLFFGVVSSVSAQLTRLNILTTGVSPTSMPSYIARDTGIFARNGLDVQVVRGTYSIATMALISGELGIIEIAGPTIVRDRKSTRLNSSHVSES